MKYKLIPLFAAALSITATFAANAQPVFSVETGHFYETVAYPAEADKSWEAANAAAQASEFAGLTGHLATITSAEENAFVSLQRSLMSGICPESCGEPEDPVETSELWIGGSQAPEQGTPGDGWTWVNEEGSIPGTNGGGGYANWNSEPQEPNDGDGTENGAEDYLAIGWGGLCPLGQCVWNDNETALFAVHGYVIEYDYTPPTAVDDPESGQIKATSGIEKKNIDVTANDTCPEENGPCVVTIEEIQPAAADGPTAVDENNLVSYTPPSNFAGVATLTYKLTDANFAHDTAVVTIQVKADEAFVEPGANQLFFNQAQNPAPGSNNPLTAAYQTVLDGGAGEVKINCCTVIDTREGAGTGGNYGEYLPVEFDLGLAISSTQSCSHLKQIGPDKAVLPPWLRGVPRSKGIPDDTDGDEHGLGVCTIESTVQSRGVVFSVEEAQNVVGYKLDCTEPAIRHRPFTGGVSINPGEVDGKYVLPWTASCDESESGKRYSDNVMVVNLWHDTNHNDTKPYLSRLVSSIKDSIELVKLQNCGDNAFMDDLIAKVQIAKKNVGDKKGDFATALTVLQNATRQALLIDKEYTTDPYGVCQDNPQGLFVGRLMAVSHATCSEGLHANSRSDSMHPDGCRIPDDIRAEMPVLPYEFGGEE